MHYDERCHWLPLHFCSFGLIVFTIERRNALLAPAHACILVSHVALFVMVVIVNEPAAKRPNEASSVSSYDRQCPLFAQGTLSLGLKTIVHEKQASKRAHRTNRNKKQRNCKVSG